MADALVKSSADLASTFLSYVLQETYHSLLALRLAQNLVMQGRLYHQANIHSATFAYFLQLSTVWL